MSADNGVYILESNDGYRVAECAAIENIDYNKMYEVVYFGDSEVFENINLALAKAFSIYLQTCMCEYGIQLLRNRGEFPKITVKYAREVLLGEHSD